MRPRGGGWEKQRMRAVASLEMRKRVVASLEISSPGGAIVVSPKPLRHSAPFEMLNTSLFE